MASKKFAVELTAAKHAPAFFMAAGRRVELSDENPRFETSDEAVYNALLSLPFLKSASAKSEEGGS